MENNFDDIERQLKDAIDKIKSQIDDLENMVGEIERKLDDSLEQIQNLKSGL